MSREPGPSCAPPILEARGPGGARRRPAPGAPARGAGPGGGADDDAPTHVEENEGLSTVLSADTTIGVQKDAGDE